MKPQKHWEANNKQSRQSIAYQQLRKTINKTGADRETDRGARQTRHDGLDGPES